MEAQLARENETRAGALAPTPEMQRQAADLAARQRARSTLGAAKLTAQDMGAIFAGGSGNMSTQGSWRDRLYGLGSEYGPYAMAIPGAQTYAAGAYRPYEDVLQESAREAGLPAIAAQTLVDTWDDMQPWPEVPALWTALPGTLRLGVVTNCSTALAGRAVRRLGHRMDVVIAAEQAGAYKPDARPYQRALEQLALPPSRVLFVAGSPADIPGASGVGMPVIWHNRLGLERSPGTQAPVAEIGSLARLPQCIVPAAPR